MSAIGYPDIGVYQHKDDGSSTPKVGYPDIGVYQHADPPAGTDTSITVLRYVNDGADALI